MPELREFDGDARKEYIMAANDIISFLELHELIPPPSLADLKTRWTEGALRDFLERYLVFLRQQAAEFHNRLNSETPPVAVFLDPLDCSRKESFLQHAFLAEVIVIIDPISNYHCPPRPLDQWLTELHGALTFIFGLKDMIRRGFVFTVPDPRHCGIGEASLERAKAILEDERARRVWYEYAHVCKGAKPARVTIGTSRTIEAPLYHFHLGPNFAMQASWPDSPEVRNALQTQAHIHFDGGGPDQKYKKLSIKNAIIYEKLEERIQKFLFAPIAQYESSLLMARLWSSDRFSTLNPLTSRILTSDLQQEAAVIADASKWVAPAECGLKVLGIESSDIGRALDFREQYLIQFRDHLAEISKIFGGIQSLPFDASFRNDVIHIVQDKIQPAFKDIEAEARSAAGSIKINSGFFGLINLAGGLLILADPKNWIVNAGTAIGSLSVAANIASEWWKGKVAQQRNPLYFLWKAKQHGLLQQKH